MIGVAVVSNIPGDEGKKIAAAIKEELEALESSIEAIHGQEFAGYVVPLTTIIANIGQLIGLLAEGPLDHRKYMIVNHMTMAFAQQTLELTLCRGEAFIKANPEHKSIKTVSDFAHVFQENSDMILNKISEYTEGKKV